MVFLSRKRARLLGSQRHISTLKFREYQPGDYQHDLALQLFKMTIIPYVQARLILNSSAYKAVWH